ncbi:hypothetical protein [Paenibacillus tundrae]|uniref:Cthe-2314-like HEPN domain-containing protein n=1 Tax=Paenibacillus tundrae TaxID=528187 RepID=A0ABT9WBF4_9BACL|nr:hypothetical protein [Paenibacillus tundrae]MDQ0170586.1 hypothetical protein [Paenibacillus tundrae]
MIEKWIHIECIFINKWGSKIINEIHKAVKEGRMERPDDLFYGYSMSIAIRLDLIGRLVQRLTKHFVEIENYLIDVKEEYIFTQKNDGFALRINDDLKLDLLIDIDAFLFEVNSCCELLGQYMYELYTALGIPLSRDKIGKTQAEILRGKGIDTSWFRKLDDSRNFFIHHAAPYIAIDVTDYESKNLIIMKDNLKTFTDPKKYMTLATLVEIREGFRKSLSIFQEHLINCVSSASS